MERLDETLRRYRSWEEQMLAAPAAPPGLKCDTCGTAHPVPFLFVLEGDRTTCIACCRQAAHARRTA